jgi:deoxyhypusine synthase
LATSWNRPRTASVVLGGGTPKNFINQASVQAEFFSAEVGGHRYALQIITDVPHFGGASGSSLEEAQSWGKLAADAARVSVHADATIALPVLTSALATTGPALLAKRNKPAFGLASRVMTIDGQTVPHERFEGVNEPTV